jgi:hypothetical protein
VRHAVIDHRAYTRVSMQNLRTAACRWVTGKGRGDIAFNERANRGELGRKCARDAIDLIRGEPFAWSLCRKQHGAASNLLAQTDECRTQVCGNRRITISGHTKLARKECRAQFGQHAGNLAARWAVARRHRTAREGGIGSGQFTTKCSSISTHRVMPFASKRPS